MSHISRMVNYDEQARLCEALIRENEKLRKQVKKLESGFQSTSPTAESQRAYYAVIWEHSIDDLELLNSHYKRYEIQYARKQANAMIQHYQQTPQLTYRDATVRYVPVVSYGLPFVQKPSQQRYRK
jgi:hypothetical protein